MKIVHQINALRAELALIRTQSTTIGLVPTMGAFHAGHESLMRAARTRCDSVVVTSFVNPKQFPQASDLSSYPRTHEQDVALAKKCGIDLFFNPAAEEIYPADFATTVSVNDLSNTLEGQSRPGHFTGVCTVVCKLFNLVGADVVFFGQKDAQQAATVKRMITDLNIPIELEVLPTVREPDGLALSSRNGHLNPEQRKQASALFSALKLAEQMLTNGSSTEPEQACQAALDLITESGLKPEYIAVVDPESFERMAVVDRPALVVGAARIGSTRLIDNVIVNITNPGFNSKNGLTMNPLPDYISAHQSPTDQRSSLSR